MLEWRSEGVGVNRTEGWDSLQAEKTAGAKGLWCPWPVHLKQNKEEGGTGEGGSTRPCRTLWTMLIRVWFIARATKKLLRDFSREVRRSEWGFERIIRWDFLGHPVVKTPHIHCRRHRFHPGWRWTKIPARLAAQNKKLSELLPGGGIVQTHSNNSDEMRWPLDAVVVGDPEIGVKNGVQRGKCQGWLLCSESNNHMGIGTIHLGKDPWKRARFRGTDWVPPGGRWWITISCRDWSSGNGSDPIGWEEGASRSGGQF